MKFHMHSVACLAAAAALFVGCSQKNDAAAETEAVAFDDAALFRVFENAGALLDAGKTNEATKVFVDALADESLAPRKDQLFSTYQRYLLFIGDVDKAKAEFLAALRTFPTEALPARDWIRGYLIETDRKDEALAWARTLQAQDLPAEMRLAAADWVMTDLLQAGDVEGAAAEAAALLAAFPAEQARPVALRHALETLLKPGAPDFAVAMRDEFVKAGAAPEAMQLTLRIAAVNGAWNDLIAALPDAPAVLDDTQLRTSFTFVTRRVRAAAAWEPLEKMCELVLDSTAFVDMKTTRNEAARQWVKLPLDQIPADKNATVARVAALASKGFTPKFTLQQYSTIFYDVVDDNAARAALDALAKKLRLEISDPSDLSTLLSHELDIAFLNDDYKGALAILEAGVPDMDEAWHKLSITKVKAHIALSEKRYDEAAAFFRDFISQLSEEPNVDPASDIIYTRAVIEANNEIRIRDFYAAAGEVEKAADAAARARTALDAAFKEETAKGPTLAFLKSLEAKLAK